MSKTLTLRLDDSTYSILKYAADAERRAISNYIEYAALKYTINDVYVSDEEMNEIKKILPGIRKGFDEAKAGKYTTFQ